MYITRALLQSFGKFNKRSVSLEKGVNIVYGPDDSGKTTFKDFVLSMLFGLSKKSGIGVNEDSFTLRRPTGASGYKGSMYLQNGDDVFLIEKDFLAGDKQTSVLNVNTGREVRLKNKDTLSGTLLEADKKSYAGAMCIDPIKGEDVDTLAGDIEKYVTNVMDTGTSDISRSEAIKYLESEKQRNSTKPLVRRLDELTEQIEEYDDVDPGLERIKTDLKTLNDEFLMEAAKRKRVARKIVENEDGSVTYEQDESLDEKIDRLTEAEQKSLEEEDKPKKLTDRLPFILLTGILVIILIAVIVKLLPFEEIVRRVFILFTAIFVILTIIDDLRLKGFFSEEDDSETPDEDDFQKVLDELREESEQREEIEFDMTFAKEFQEKKDALREEEKALLKRKSERTHLKAEFNDVFKKKSMLEKEIAAINLAISRIRTISNEMRKTNYQAIFVKSEKFIRRLLGDDYGRMTMSNEGHLFISVSGSTLRINQLSEEELRKLYLAIRLSVAANLAPENVPLIIDDAIKDVSLRDMIAFAQCVDSLGLDQVIVLTSDERLDAIFEGAEIPYNMTTL